MEKDPRVDAYMAGVADFAQPIFAHLRQLAHAALPDGAETLKWGKPTFSYKGKNVATFAAFKAHAMFVVHGTGRQSDGEEGGRIAGLADLPSDADLTSALKDAAERIDADGTATKHKAPRKERGELPLPADFAAALAEHPKAKATLDGFAPSHRRDYVEWVAAAKREDTRAKRIADSIEWLSAGKKRLWMYEK